MTKVKIYSTPTCPYCVMAKEFFKENKVEFEDIDVSENRKAAEEMVEKTNQMSVPVIMVDKDGKEEIVLGFDKEKLLGLLELN